MTSPMRSHRFGVKIEAGQSHHRYQCARIRFFFSGPPARILKAWQDGRFRIVLSEDILDEYRRVIQTLAVKLGHIDFEPILEKLLIESQLVPSCVFQSSVCEDPDDDKFLACAMVSQSNYLVTGDNHLLKIGKFPTPLSLRRDTLLIIFPDITSGRSLSNVVLYR